MPVLASQILKSVQLVGSPGFGSEASGLRSCALCPTRHLGLLLGILLLVVLSGTAFAQNEAESVPQAAATPASPMVNPAASETAIVAEIPDFHLTQVQLDADVVADRVNLVATIEVMINRGEGWHRVPLRLAGLHVFRREYSGPGEEAADVTPRPMDEGLVWLFKGLGKHQLKLHAWIPLKHTVAGGQFQLPLPTLPSQFEARLHTRIPDPTAIVRSGKNLTVLDIKRGPNDTQVEASVVGNLLLFSWQTPAAGGETVSLVQSWLHLKPSQEHLSLVVEQNIELQQTTTDSIEVTLPPGFRLIQLSGQHYRSHEILADRPNRVRVQFANDNLGRLTLNWGFERDLSPNGGLLQIEGLHVEGAVREEGVIRIDEFDNLLMVPHPQESQLVHSIGVNQVRTLGTGIPLAAYEFLRQPFRLVFEVQPSVPYFSVEPVDQLRFLNDSIELTVNCRVRFERGSISELKLAWPNWQQEDWRVVSLNADTNRTGPLAYDATSQPGIIRLWWPNPLGRREGDASFTVVFRRPRAGTPNNQVDLTLPTPQASETEPTIVKLESADQLSVELFTGDSMLLPRLPTAAELPELALMQPKPGEPVPRTYRIEKPSDLIVARIQTHDREVRTQAQVEIKESSSSKLRVDQTIQFDVKYGRMRMLELVIPPALKAHIPDSGLTQGIEVTSQGQRLPLLPGKTPDVLQADLGSERIGTFDIKVAYSFPVPEDQATRDVELPIVSVKDQPFKRIECLIDAVDSVQVRSGSTDWEALQTSPSHARWINVLKNGPVSQIPLTMGRKLADSSQQFVVDQVQVRTIFSADGSAESWAEFQLERPQSRLVLDFPVGTDFKENAFLVDGRPLPVQPERRRTKDFEEVTIALPQQANARPLVTVRYRTPLPAPFGLTNSITLPLPRFKENVWVDETIWEMQLPPGIHLFTYPDLLPQFQWTRNFLIWYRESTPAYQEERSLHTMSQVPPEFRFEQRKYYAFRGFGPIQQVSFRSMNRSLILLIGAGFALFLGFIFWNIPATRNVFSLVVISFLFAAASLYYVEPMLLLLQPAIFGVFLALAATVIDSSSQRQHPDRSHLRVDRTHPPEAKEDSSLRSMSTRIYRPVPAGKSDRIEG
ncbi:hypothetical protein SH661x_003598 [Planctomicrobium sp. SH661]|uniref:hypothetical protein n=1 Tax=Planctomicrobium sp. SH661 TaxID=3448124 RepID=UPI003F5C3FBF